jgi:serine/threonine protein phosphatase 1
MKLYERDPLPGQLPPDTGLSVSDGIRPALRARKRFGIFPRRHHVSSVPAGRRVYAIGDIHGCHEQLVRLLGRISNEMAKSRGRIDLVFLGDYIDRGPQSREVIATLIDLPANLHGHFIRGNHEQALLDFLDRPITYREWARFGAEATLLSYGVAPPQSSEIANLTAVRDRLARAMPPAHLRFLRSLRPSVAIGDYLFVHAGIRPGVPLSRQTDHDLMWIRDEFLNSDADHGKVVVHGHTPFAEPVNRDNRISVDTGAYMTGKLTALVLEGRRRSFLCG